VGQARERAIRVVARAAVGDSVHLGFGRVASCPVQQRGVHGRRYSAAVVLDADHALVGQDREVPVFEAVRREGELAIDPRHAAALRDLVRLIEREPGLRAVWLETHAEAEGLFAAIVAEATGRSPHELDLRVHVAVFNLAMRIAVEDWARSGDPAAPAPLEALTDSITATLHAVGRTLDAS
jgi:hypothetical protein